MDLSTIQPVLDWISRHPELSGLIIFLVAAGESLALVGIVVPGVVFMLGIGTLVGLNAIDLWQALLWAVAGAIVGDWVSYWLGRHFDQQLRHVWPLSRYPKLIPQGEKFFARHGGASVFFGRFVGPLRPIIPAVAGIMHMPQGKFYFINIVSAILWAPVVILPGVAFGESIQLANEVFFRIIAVIVLLIVIALVVGYVTKRLVAYALMSTIETLGGFFGFREAKENIVSLSLIAVLAGGVMLFVHRYEIAYQPIASQQQAVDPQWWYEHWNRFSNAPVKFESKYPITLQWWGGLKKIRVSLLDNGWITAPELNIKNSLNYFLPEPKTGQLPVWGAELFNNKEALVLLAPGAASNNFYVLRLWAANPNVDKDKPQLWVGTVQSIDVLSVFNLFHMPVTRSDYSESLALLQNKVENVKPPLTVRRRSYEGPGFTDSWKGEVLLLNFSAANSTPAVKDGVSGRALQEVGNTGLYLKYPKAFVQQHVPLINGNEGQQLQKNSYEMRDNGVVANVTYVNNADTDLTLSTLQQEIHRQLEQVEGLQTLQITTTESELGDIDGVHLIARYDMPPFGKQVVYHVLVAIKGFRVWRVTVFLKDCDNEGQRQVGDMLESIAIFPRV